MHSSRLSKRRCPHCTPVRSFLLPKQNPTNIESVLNVRFGKMSTPDLDLIVEAVVYVQGLRATSPNSAKAMLQAFALSFSKAKKELFQEIYLSLAKCCCTFFHGILLELKEIPERAARNPSALRNVFFFFVNEREKFPIFMEIFNRISGSSRELAKRRTRSRGPGARRRAGRGRAGPPRRASGSQPALRKSPQDPLLPLRHSPNTQCC